jgi:hypothetical protein
MAKQQFASHRNCPQLAANNRVNHHVCKVLRAEAPVFVRRPGLPLRTRQTPLAISWPIKTPQPGERLSLTQRIEPREPGQVLILEAISGHDWDGGSLTPTPPPSPQGGPPTLPPSVFYFVSYHGLPHTDPPQPVMPSFDVSVTEYPNSAWAHYSLRNYPTINASITTANSIQRVSKFGNRIYVNSAWIYPDGKGTTYFYWPSGNFAVAIRFYSPTEDVVLQKYLALHPSSL